MDEQIADLNCVILELEQQRAWALTRAGAMAVEIGKLTRRAATLQAELEEEKKKNAQSGQGDLAKTAA